LIALFNILEKADVPLPISSSLHEVYNLQTEGRIEKARKRERELGKSIGNSRKGRCCCWLWIM